MGFTIFLGILGLIALALIVSGVLSRGTIEIDRSDVSKRKLWLIPGIIVFAIFSIVLISGSVTNVTARTVGIVTEFGKATGTVSPGFNWIAPWAEVTEFSTGNNSLDLDTTDGNGGNVAVKFVGGGAGAANVNINWQVQDDSKATKLWENWKEFSIVADKVVNKQAQAVVYQVVGRYTPEDAVKSESIIKINKQINDELNTALAASGIRVENVAVMRIDLSSELQDRVNKQNQAVTDQQTAKTNQETAKIEAGTNEIKQRQLTPLTLMDKCLDIVNKWSIVNNGPMPAAGVCGAAPPLVLNAK